MIRKQYVAFWRQLRHKCHLLLSREKFPGNLLRYKKRETARRWSAGGGGGGMGGGGMGGGQQEHCICIYIDIDICIRMPDLAVEL